MKRIQDVRDAQDDSAGQWVHKAVFNQSYVYAVVPALSQLRFSSSKAPEVPHFPIRRQFKLH